MDEELNRLIRRARSGDQVAFSELVTRYKGRVYRYAAGMLGDRSDAEDVTQEAFVKAYFSLDALDHDYAFTSWLFRIVSNLCKDYLRKRGKTRNAEAPPPDETIPDPSRSDPIGNLSLKISLDEALRHLSVDHREVLLLYDVQGFRYDEIAELVHVPLGTVKSRLFAARMALRNELKEEGLK
ncbi:RNA polymerase sigma24 factor [Paenibacillus stellifer]|uniref:RNA polymerase sigma factor n=1 Tax=Paenibacillus stellifer TaxID=169760 RepID=A0A089LRJ1_9BACL|nr:RNA polymerase sigma factor [Paenibacillus stellifer]AIQ64171.1 RNA polymerase sigma24 factor [Paenibacillus stellifer]